MRIWAREFKDNRMIKDTLVEDTTKNTRTKKVLSSLETVCKDFDLSIPIWLDSNINDFKRNATTRFTADSFIESIDFDYLEFRVIEED